MSSPNGLLSQKLCHYRNQGRTLNDILTPKGRTVNGFFSLSQCTESVRTLAVMTCDAIKWLWGPPASKMWNSRLSK